jgi:hypothetical protein
MVLAPCVNADVYHVLVSLRSGELLQLPWTWPFADSLGWPN